MPSVKQLRRGERGKMNPMAMRKCSRALSGFFVACLAFAAHGSTNVFNDAVFWFRGGKDLNSDGYIRQGEFFDDLHADDPTHANHKMSMSTSYYTGDSAGFRANAVIRSEPVVFPALGKGVVKNMRVLRISNVAVKPSGSTKNYYLPFVVNPHSVFADNNISNKYTIVSRVKLDEDGLDRDECLFKIGYSASAKQGMYLSLAKSPASSGITDIGSRYIKGKCTPNSGSDDASFNFPIRIPTNTWVDLAVVVGNGKLRVGIATPESSANHGDNPTIAFAETDMWTDNCPLLSDGYRMFCFNGQTAPKEANAADQTCFIGSVQQLAIWGRALSDQEVMEAFGMPRPAIFRIGFDNGSSHEFGGTRSGSSQEIDGLGSWQDIANTMKVGDTWTVNFTALRDEANLAQILTIKSLPDSATATIEPRLNDQSLGEMRMAKDGCAFWPVPKELISAGENTLVIERKNGGGDVFKIDAMELGGSLGVGKMTASSEDDGRVDPERIKTGVPSAADPNTQHWPQELRPSTGITNLHFRVWVDPDVSDRASFVMKTATQCCDAIGTESFTIYINEVSKSKLRVADGWQQHKLDFQPGELQGGWNDFEFIAPLPYPSCYWRFGYFRFETVLPSAFSFPPFPGLSVFIR